MKKLLLLLLIISFGILSSLQLSDFTTEEQNKIKDHLIEEIELDPGETIASVEGEKYNILDFTDDYWIVIDDDGEVILVPAK